MNFYYYYYYKYYHYYYFYYYCNYSLFVVIIPPKCNGDEDSERSLSISQHGNFLSPPAFCTDLSLVPTFPVAHNPLLPSFSLLQNNDKFQSIWTATIQMISASQLKTMININWQIVVPCIAECPTINCCRKGSLQCTMEQCTMHNGTMSHSINFKVPQQLFQKTFHQRCSYYNIGKEISICYGLQCFIHRPTQLICISDIILLSCMSSNKY